MKTSKLSALLAVKAYLMTLAIAIATVLGTYSANAAQPVPPFELTLIENSSTNLTYTYDGPSTFMITPNGSDHWTVSVMSGSATFFDFTWDWIEPEDSNKVNEVYSGDMTATHTSFSVISDESLLQYGGGVGTLLPNNTTTPTFVGSDGVIGIVLTFNDLAAAPEAAVPETGSTLGLLGIAAIALVGFRRLRVLKLA